MEFRFKCKKCGGPLYLVSMRVSCAIPLASDGFSTHDAEFFDTFDEVIRCKWCRRFSDLEYTEEPV